MLIIGRVIAGMGASGIINGALTIISCVVPLHKRPAMMGALMGCGQMGLVVGPLIGGAFTQVCVTASLFPHSMIMIQICSRFK